MMSIVFHLYVKFSPHPIIYVCQFNFMGKTSFRWVFCQNRLKYSGMFSANPFIFGRSYLIICVWAPHGSNNTMNILSTLLLFLFDRYCYIYTNCKNRYNWYWAIFQNQIEIELSICFGTKSTFTHWSVSDGLRYQYQANPNNANDTSPKCFLHSQ